MAESTHELNDIYQLAYVSSATVPLVFDDIRAIELVSIGNNIQCGITGLLTYCDGKFMQFLEGQASHVKQTFAKIEKDDRHHSIDILREGKIPKRQFKGWYMKYASVDEIQKDEGNVHDKLFSAQLTEVEQFDKANETFALLYSFKNSCSNQLYTKRDHYK